MYLDALLGHYEGVLELCRSFAIPRHCCPIVWPSLVATVATEIDHRLHCENMTWLHDPNSFVLSVMGHLGRPMEKLADAMPAICRDYCAGILGCLSMNCITKITVKCT